jgi:hypothetical protein
MDAATATTTYTSSRRTTRVLAAVLLFTLVVPLLVLIDEDGPRRISEEFARYPKRSALAGAFWSLFLTIVIAGVRANYLMTITCDLQACRYRLPHITAWEFFRRPFALRSGKIPYAMISGVEKRREGIKWGQTCSAVCLIVDDQPVRTFVRGGVGDHEWVEDFARDISARARVILVDRGTVSSMWAPWREAS